MFSLASKSDEPEDLKEARRVLEAADRIVRLLLAREETVVFARDNPDADVEVSQTTRDRWADKVNTIRGEIAAVAEKWKPRAVVDGEIKSR